MAKSMWIPPDLKGKVAVVTGASRGLGKGIALVLGECGATVYIAARSSGVSAASDQATGTIEETAAEVTARGGNGIPVKCDASNLEDLKALFERVKSECAGLDILVNNAWGGYEGFPGGLPMAYFWQTPFDSLWRGMIESGLRAHMAATHAAVPLMLTRPGGLIASTIAWDRDQYIGGVYDVSKHAIVRFLLGLSRELKEPKIAALAVAPGFKRTERVLAAFKTDEQHWKDIPYMKQTESPEYCGRAVASLAADPKLMKRTGQAFRVGDLAREYGFTDTDGRRVPPYTVKYSFEKMVQKFAAKSAKG